MSKMKSRHLEDHSSNRHQHLNGACHLFGHFELCGIKKRYCVQANIIINMVF